MRALGASPKTNGLTIMYPEDSEVKGFRTGHQMNFSRLFIPAHDIASLVWRGDTLVDWVRGGAVFHLDGKCQEARVAWGHPFDAACATPDGWFAVVYERVGTKALLLRDGRILRELNRSYYQAKAYEYPICIWRNADHRTLIAHCPEEYCRIDIEDAESGACLTVGKRKPQDFFHSRLMVNTARTRLLSAGWVWHPLDSIMYFDIIEALRNPEHLDRADNTAPGSFHVGLAEHASACWQSNERALLGASSEEEDPTEVAEPNASALRLRPRGIAVYDVVSHSYIKSVVLDEVAGTMMPLGERYAVCFYKHPRVVSLDSGETVLRWDDLDTGSQVSSIIWDKKHPPLALDSENRRFAVAGADGITVIQIDMAR
jgi:hypothetical protein